MFTRMSLKKHFSVEVGSVGRIGVEGGILGQNAKTPRNLELGQSKFQSCPCKEQLQKTVKFRLSISMISLYRRKTSPNRVDLGRDFVAHI